MDCVIRVINGPDAGQEHRLRPGANLIGRGTRAALRLSPEDVSWEHAVISRQGEEYYVENLSALGTWVGDAKITGKVRLRPRDKVRLTRDTVLRLDAADGGGGVMSGRGFLAGAVVVLLGLLAGVVFYQGRSDGRTGAGADDWPAAYNTLAPWLRQQTARRKVAPEAVDLFQTAWRLEQVGDYAHSHKVWLRLQVVLATAEPQLRSMGLAEQETAVAVGAGDRRRAMKSLQKLLAPPTPDYTPSEDELSAAMAEFVERRLTYSRDQLDTSILKPS